VNGSVRKKTWLREKSRVFALRIMGFPPELETVRFNSEPKRYKSVPLSAKRSVFTLVGLTPHGVVTGKLRLNSQQVRGRTKDGNPLGWRAHHDGRNARGQADHEELAHMVG